MSPARSAPGPTESKCATPRRAFDEKTRQRDVISARITPVFDENTPAEKRETLNVPMRKIGDLMLVRSFRRGA